MPTTRDLMTEELMTVGVNDRIGDVRDLMLHSGIHCVPVVDDEGHPLGVVTSWDMVEEHTGDESVMRAMTDKVVTIGPDEALSEAAALMMTNWIHHLVVVDEQSRVQGLLSSFDLLGLIADERVS